MFLLRAAGHAQKEDCSVVREIPPSHGTSTIPYCLLFWLSLSNSAKALGWGRIAMNEVPLLASQEHVLQSGADVKTGCF